MSALKRANADNTAGYGNDLWTQRAITQLKEIFECDLEAFFVSTGTAANTLALSCLVQPWEVMLCHHQSHIYLDESTGPEFFTGGARMVPIAQGAAKITPEHLTSYFQQVEQNIPHNPIARSLSLTQTSEAGVVYLPDEIQALTSYAKQKGLLTHMDGARFANAVASLGCSPAEISWKVGIDVLCLGATKCGALNAEAVIFFNKPLSETFSYRRKRSGHLLSKGRLFGAQFSAWLENNHWLNLAAHANQQASLLANTLTAYPQIRLAWPTHASQVFVTMPKCLAKYLQDNGADFFDWNPAALPANFSLNDDEIFIRLVTSFATTDQEREMFTQQVADYFRKID